MGLNDTPSGERIHIGFFGRRNAGKSSLVNAVTNQDIAVVSDVKGTTTDPVIKSMELLPLGPVVIIDTPGFDDEGSLGELRVKKTKQILNKTDIAVLVVDISVGLGECENELISIFKEKNVPYIVAYNKSDLITEKTVNAKNEILVSAVNKTGINELKDLIGVLFGNDKTEKKLVGDLVKPGDFVVLVVPIDKAAPKGRLILPQQQVIRDLLDNGISTIVVRETELSDTLNSIGVKPKLVITDSQVFEQVSKIVPDDIYLTSFSILMARYKGFLETAIKGVKAIDELKPGDKVLISEGCSHHRQCGDIGTVKIPAWIRKYIGGDVLYDTTSGGGFVEDLSEYKLIIHCGGCMLNEREMVYRMKCAIDAGVPFTNYGIIIAKMKGILDRSIQVLKREKY